MPKERIAKLYWAYHRGSHGGQHQAKHVNAIIDWYEKYACNEEATGLTPSQQTHEPDEYDLLEQDLNVVQTFADNWESFIAADPTEMSTKTALEWWCQEQQ